MDVPPVSDDAGGTVDEQQTDVGSSQKHCNYSRFSKEQVAKLEQLFNASPHPGDYDQSQLAKELGVNTKKVKFWFQNKRTQEKKKLEQQDSNFLRSENEKIQTNIILMRETLKFPICSSPSCSNSKSSLMMTNLNVENVVLRKQRERLSKLELVQNNSGMDQNNETIPTFQSCDPPSQENFPNQNSETIPPHHQDIHPPPNQNFSTLPQADDAPAPAINQELYANTSELYPQHIPTPPFGSIPVMDPLFRAITPSHSQNIPNLYHAHAPTHVQNFTTLEPADQNIIPASSILDYQDIPALDEQNISAFASASAPEMNNILTLDDHHIPSFGVGVLDGGILSNPIILTPDMMETANNAMEELTKLLNVNEPFWFRSSTDGKFILERENYQKMYPKYTSLNRPHAYAESSKDSRTVSMSGTQLVDMFLNADKFVDLFPAIVKSAQTLQVFESGETGSRNGAIQLMNAEIHILSPLVPVRHFVFLRYCKRVGVGVWVIADASLESSMYDTPLSSKRLPSGCMIHEIGNGRCRVTWVEHVEVSDGIQTDQLFREVICRNNAYGAERWVLTLERMCERLASASLETIPITDAGGVISSTEGRRNLMKFGHRMMKTFYGTLEMKNNMDFPHLNTMNDDGVRVCVQKRRYPSGQEDMVVSAATSFWLPLSPHILFDFLKDNTKRPQWDILCRACPAHEIQRIINGSNPENYTSIIRPSIPREHDLLIMQESYTHDLESVLVYAPINIETLNLVMNGGDTSLLPLLPSGFTITRDGCAEEQLKGKGSLVTLAYQVPRTPSAYMQDQDLVNLVNKLVAATVKKIKVGLNCYNI